MTDKPPCPNCQSTAWTKLAHAAHCNQCGHDWNVTKTAIPTSTRDHAHNGYTPAPKFASADLIPPQDPQTFVQPKPKSTEKK
jgi:hypothetical protein